MTIAALDAFDQTFGTGDLFTDDRASLGASFDQIFTEVQAEARARDHQRRDPAYLHKLMNAATFLSNVAAGRVPSHRLMEAMSTSDFPILFGDIFDRRLMQNYQATTPTWSMYCSEGTNPDFRPSRIIAIDGLEQPFFPDYKNAELEEPKYDDVVKETGYTTSVEMFVKAYAINWRMLINRSLNFISQFPARLARGALRTEEKFATSLYVASTGPRSPFFSVGNGNIVTGNPALSINGVRAAFNALYAQTDIGGDPIEITGAVLVVPPLLKLTAQEILKSVNWQVNPGITNGIGYETPNWLGDIKLAVNWYLPLVDQSANRHTTWYLFADPKVGRPALEMTFLEGYRQPSFWQKAPNTMRMGTNTVNNVMGDFADMSQHYKGVHILGGTLLDPKAAVVSNGSGS